MKIMETGRRCWPERHLKNEETKGEKKTLAGRLQGEGKMNIAEKIEGHPKAGNGTAFAVLFTMGFCHLLNDMIQSVVPAMYPLMK